MVEPHILHVDMDAFFVSVELLDRPDLLGREVIVAHESGRGVVTSASYEARKYGVRSAMPVQQALQRCPHAVIIPPSRDKYTFYSAQLMQVLGEFSPTVEPLSIDEAFVDLSGAFRLLGDAETIGHKIRSEIRQRLKLPATIGIADRKFIAKIASTAAKPDGLLVIRPDERLTFLHSLPVSALWGVGAKTQEVLDRYGIHTVAELASIPQQKLVRMFGKHGAQLYELAHGHDNRSVEPERAEKSISTEQTFEIDLIDLEQMKRKLLQLSHKVAQRLRAQELTALTVGLKVKYASFKQVVRSVTLEIPTDEAHQLHHYSQRLLEQLAPLPEPVRLLGVRAGNLVHASGNIQLGFDDLGGQRRQSEVTMDEIKAKFPSLRLGPASLFQQHQK
ncbi:DNA polymerase IV [Micrococcoides hystricis]|uniref:DNA polymerase IV n=1 Tax=Micrococcoides hystricis TaxID=1572761 RepID=A0ABV6P7K5_9MICC